MSDDFIRDFGTAIDRAAAQVANGQAPSQRRWAVRPAMPFIAATAMALTVIAGVMWSNGTGARPEEQPAATAEVKDSRPAGGLQDIQPPPDGLAGFPLTVANGTTAVGLGAAYGDSLENAGWTVSAITNASGTDHAITAVVYWPERQQDAESIAEALALPVRPATDEDELGFPGEPPQETTRGIAVVLGTDAAPLKSRPAPAPLFGGTGSQFPDCPAKVYKEILELNSLAAYARMAGYPAPGCPTIQELGSEPLFMAEFDATRKDEQDAAGEPDFPVNEDGQTYGSTDSVGFKDYPDLILVEASNGRQGYVENDVLNEVTGANVSSPAEAVAWQRKMDAAGQASKWIPVYLSDGKTQIGTFEVDLSAGDGLQPAG